MPPRRAGSGRAAALVALLLPAACAAPPPARAPDPALAAAAAVAEIRSGAPPRCDATGAATHLGGGRFVTAAHVVDGSAQRLRGDCPPGPPAVLLSVRGAPAPAVLLRAGRDRVDRGIGQRYLAGEDVALLRPAAALPQLGAATPCAADPAPGAPVLLVSPVRALRTRISDIHRDRDPAFGSYLEIPVALQPGESGGAVFEAASGCLAGLISHRDGDAGPPGTRLVPASVIRRFAAP
ncbi:trypsin-like peptidase domain-containing protein [Falsiroseomonas sp. CW058]|uniref:trypsin-like peptidase domain-containing protein n=1 Tax=Falsiroseomonas sp. CW058 TaxID=3388664 RepID=UPI003D31B89D